MKVSLEIVGKGKSATVLLKKIEKGLVDVANAENKTAESTKKLETENKKLDKSNKDVTKSNKKVKSGLEKTGTSALKTADIMRQLRNGLLAVATFRFGVGFIRQFTDLVDSTQNLDVQLRTVLTPLNDVKQIYDTLGDSANQLGTNIDSGIVLFSRLTRATKELGVSQKDLLAITNNIQASFVLSGASTQEATNAIIQLSQGFSAGALRGDEFRAVMEQAPVLIDALKDSLNVTQGELIKMAFAGDLTSDKLIKAFKDMGEGIRKETDRLPQTTEKAFNRLGNQLKKYVRESETVKNINLAVAKTVNLLANNLSGLANLITSIVIVALLKFIQKIVVLNSTFGFTTGLVTNLKRVMKGLFVIGGIGLAITAITSMLNYFEDIKKAQQDIIDKNAKIPDSFNQIIEKLAQIKSLQTEGKTSTASAVANDAVNNLKNQIDSFIKQRDLLVKLSSDIANEKTKPLAKFDNLIDSVAISKSIDEIQLKVTGLNKKIKEASDQSVEFVRALSIAGVDLTDTDAITQFYNQYIKDKQKAIDLSFAEAKAEDDRRVATELATKNGKKLVETLDKQIAKKKLDILLIKGQTEEYLRQSIAQATVGIEDENLIKSISDKIRKNFELTKSIEQLNKVKSSSNKVDEITAKSLKKDINKALNDYKKGLIDITKLITTLKKIKGKAIGKSLNAIVKELNTSIDSLSSKKSTQEQIDKLNELIKTEELNLKIINATGDSKTELIAIQELTRAGINTENEALKELIKRYVELVEEQGKVKNFEAKIGGINRFISGLSGLANAFKNFSNDVGGALRNMVNGVTSALDGLKGIGVSGGAIDALEKAVPIAGVIVQGAQLLDSLAGGKLFGTNYQVESQSINATLTDVGFIGSQTLTEVRQRSLFRGRKWRTTVSELSSEIIGFLDELFLQIDNARKQIARRFNQQITPLVTGTFSQVTDENGNVTSSTSTINGRKYNDATIQDFGDRLKAENVLAGLRSMFGDVAVEVTHIIDVFGNEFQDGFNGFSGIIEFTATEMINEIDAIAERWRGNAQQLLEGSLFLKRASEDFFDGTNIVASLTDLTNLVEELTTADETLSQTYERLLASTQLITDVFKQFNTDIGLADVALVRFSDDIVEAFGGLGEASSELSTFIDSFFNGISGLRRNAEVLNQESLTSLASIGLDATTTMEQFKRRFLEALPNLTPTQIATWVRAGNALNDATTAQERYTNALIAQAKKVQALQKKLESLANSLFGAINNLDQVNAEIARLEQEQQSIIQTTTQAGNDLFEQWASALQDMRKYLDNLLLDPNLSPLNPQQQLQEALAQFDDLVARANNGDIGAYNDLPDLINRILGLARSVEASGVDYNAIYDYVTGLAGGITNPTSPDSGNNNTVELVPSDRLIELYAQRDALEQVNLEQGIFQFADTVRQYVSLTGQTINEVLDGLGVDLTQLISGLNIDLNNLDGNMVRKLSQLANVLGVNLSNLSSDLSIDLGNIADANSLINDGLEAVIATLPDGIRDRLSTLLENVEDAVSPEQQVSAINDLINETNTLPSEYSNLLAPFFDEINVVSQADQQLILLETQVSILDDILIALIDPPPEPNTPIPIDPAPTTATITELPEPVVTNDNNAVDISSRLNDLIAVNRDNANANAQDLADLIAEMRRTADANELTNSNTGSMIDLLNEINSGGTSIN